MLYGIGSGFLWAFETVLLSIALAAGVFTKSPRAIFLAPLICAFLNDAIASIWLLAIRKTLLRGQGSSILTTFRHKSGWMLLLSGLCGGPLGMSAYLLSIKYVGPTYTAMLSALYPALGAVLSRIFLKETLTKRQVVSIVLCVAGAAGVAGIPGRRSHTESAYFLFGIICALLWGLEAVCSSYAMKRAEISFASALQIRMWTSVACYAVLVLPLLGAWNFTLHAVAQGDTWLILATAAFEAGSCLLYYKAIHVVGPSKAMTMNITYIVWAFLLGVAVLHNVPQPQEIIGLVLIFAGAIHAAK